MLRLFSTAKNKLVGDGLRLRREVSDVGCRVEVQTEGVDVRRGSASRTPVNVERVIIVDVLEGRSIEGLERTEGIVPVGVERRPALTVVYVDLELLDYARIRTLVEAEDEHRLSVVIERVSTVSVRADVSRRVVSWVAVFSVGVRIVDSRRDVEVASDGSVCAIFRWAGRAECAHVVERLDVNLLNVPLRATVSVLTTEGASAVALVESTEDTGSYDILCSLIDIESERAEFSGDVRGDAENFLVEKEALVDALLLIEGLSLSSSEEVLELGVGHCWRCFTDLTLANGQRSRTSERVTEDFDCHATDGSNEVMG